MASDKMNQFMVTADVDGFVKVWHIVEYATAHVDDPILEPPREYDIDFMTMMITIMIVMVMMTMMMMIMMMVMLMMMMMITVMIVMVMMTIMVMVMMMKMVMTVLVGVWVYKGLNCSTSLRNTT